MEIDDDSGQGRSFEEIQALISGSENVAAARSLPGRAEEDGKREDLACRIQRLVLEQKAKEAELHRDRRSKPALEASEMDEHCMPELGWKMKLQDLESQQLSQTEHVHSSHYPRSLASTREPSPDGSLLSPAFGLSLSSPSHSNAFSAIASDCSWRRAANGEHMQEDATVVEPSFREPDAGLASFHQQLSSSGVQLALDEPEVGLKSLDVNFSSLVIQRPLEEPAMSHASQEIKISSATVQPSPEESDAGKASSTVDEQSLEKPYVGFPTSDENLSCAVPQQSLEEPSVSLPSSGLRDRIEEVRGAFREFETSLNIQEVQGHVSLERPRAGTKLPEAAAVHQAQGLVASRRPAEEHTWRDEVRINQQVSSLTYHPSGPAQFEQDASSNFDTYLPSSPKSFDSWSPQQPDTSCPLNRRRPAGAQRMFKVPDAAQDILDAKTLTSEVEDKACAREADAETRGKERLCSTNAVPERASPQHAIARPLPPQTPRTRHPPSVRRRVPDSPESVVQHGSATPLAPTPRTQRPPSARHRVPDAPPKSEVPNECMLPKVTDSRIRQALPHPITLLLDEFNGDQSINSDIGSHQIKSGTQTLEPDLKVDMADELLPRSKFDRASARERRSKSVCDCVDSDQQLSDDFERLLPERKVGGRNWRGIDRPADVSLSKPSSRALRKSQGVTEAEIAQDMVTGNRGRWGAISVPRPPIAYSRGPARGAELGCEEGLNTQYSCRSESWWKKSETAHQRKQGEYQSSILPSQRPLTPDSDFVEGKRPCGCPLDVACCHWPSGRPPRSANLPRLKGAEGGKSDSLGLSLAPPAPCSGKPRWLK